MNDRMRREEAGARVVTGGAELHAVARWKGGGGFNPPSRPSREQSMK